MKNIRLSFFRILTATWVLGFFVVQAETPSELPEKESIEGTDPVSGHVFAWPFLDAKKMQPQGGNTKGSEVTLMKGKRLAWKHLKEQSVSKKEQDKRAILAMAGSFRVSFDFIELTGFSENYTPPKPYFSWGTEYVHILEESEDFVSLQHALVMFFKDEKGDVSGPHVMKHWRQDWTYEDEEIFVFKGNLSWKKEKVEGPTGRWSQAVYQVDDSPRYEVMGTWTHEGGLHQWRSDDAPRPLPRREFSVREDYSILAGYHEITITPNGWAHVQQNRKISPENGVVGTELGVNRYEAIEEPELKSSFLDYWKKTEDYWQAVRTEWEKISEERDSFSLRRTVDGKKTYQLHFTRAAELEKFSTEENREHAASTVRGFVQKSPD